MRVMLLLAALVLGGCGSVRELPRTGTAVFESVRVDQEAGVVEIDGIVPIDCHHPETPDVYLETIVCGQDSKEHESLVMTRALPSHIHAALLLVGLEPGRPATWSWDGEALRPVTATGDRLLVEIVSLDSSGDVVSVEPGAWIVNVLDGSAFETEGWVFGGSRMVEWEGRDYYDADGTGVVVGLTTFGSEVASLLEVYSHDSMIDEPEWIANRERVPERGTEVVVRLRRVED